jgi:hypothetical protein
MRRIEYESYYSGSLPHGHLHLEALAAAAATTISAWDKSPGCPIEPLEFAPSFFEISLNSLAISFSTTL